MELKAVETSYARWAPVYDRTFGALTDIGRRNAVRYMNQKGGHVLEVGVGTGMALPYYAPHMRVTGIDFSGEMLAKAQSKVTRLGIADRVELHRMDARELAFEDDSFDTVAAMHVLSVVPEPERVMAEISRVLKPGGTVVITNHFARASGLLGGLSRAAAPLADILGWHSDFQIATVLKEPKLSLRAQQKLPPLGMMTLLTLEKVAA